MVNGPSSWDFSARSASLEPGRGLRLRIVSGLVTLLGGCATDWDDAVLCGAFYFCDVARCGLRQRSRPVGPCRPGFFRESWGGGGDLEC